MLDGIASAVLAAVSYLPFPTLSCGSVKAISHYDDRCVAGLAQTHRSSPSKR